ncbi:hypothetical protein GCM10009608_36640 [Pseudonocardia alaniniphila]
MINDPGPGTAQGTAARTQPTIIVAETERSRPDDGGPQARHPMTIDLAPGTAPDIAARTEPAIIATADPAKPA